MNYQTGTMRMTRTCLELGGSNEVEVTGLLKAKINYPNGSYSNIDLLTGNVEFNSSVHKNATYKPENYVNNSSLSYKTMLAYFEDADGNLVYRKPTVHAMLACLTPYHRELLFAAMERDAMQMGCDLSKSKVNVHHIDCNSQNNYIPNLLPVTRKEHLAIHKAQRNGASTYDALVAGMGEELVNEIFCCDFFDYGDGGVYTAAIMGESYMQLMLRQLSDANLPADTKCLRVRLLNKRYDCIDIADMNIYEILSALYNIHAIEIEYPCVVKDCPMNK